MQDETRSAGGHGDPGSQGAPELRPTDVPSEPAEVIEPPLGLSESMEDRFDLGDRSLREHAARGVLINSAFQIGLSTLGLLKRVGVAAFLTASEFGLWGLMITTLIALTYLKEIGISDKYIQQDEQDQVAAFHKAFTLELGYTLLFFVLVVVALPLYALFIYGRPEIIVPGLVLSLVLLTSAFRTPLWILYRKMQFVRQRTLEAIDPVLSTVVMIGLAASGMTYWALIIGTLAGAVAGSVAAVVTCPYPFKLRYERGTLREYFNFSWPLFVQGLAQLLTLQGAIIVGNWTVGLAGVGAIGLAGQFSVYVVRVDGIISRTMYPAVTAVKDRTAVLAETFVKSNRIGLMWGLPFGVGLFFFGPDLVDHVLGSRWEIAEPLLQSFGLILAIRQIGFNWGLYMKAANRTKPLALDALLSTSVLLCVTTPLMFALGLDGYVIGASVDVVLSLALRGYFMSRMFAGFSIVRHMARALAPMLPVVAVMALLRALESGERTLGLALGELAVYVAVTVIATWVFERRLLIEAVSYIRGKPRPVAGGTEALAG